MELRKPDERRVMPAARRPSMVTLNLARHI
jgi:hypothetical protein